VSAVSGFERNWMKTLGGDAFSVISKCPKIIPGKSRLKNYRVARPFFIKKWHITCFSTFSGQ